MDFFGGLDYDKLAQKIAADESVFLIGQGVTSPWYVGATTTGLLQRFGAERIIDTPVMMSVVSSTSLSLSRTLILTL